MDISAAVVPKPAHRYRLPALLQDIRLLDLLEISGTTLEAGRVCGLSQPTVSRRSRLLADDFGLADTDQPILSRKRTEHSYFKLVKQKYEVCMWLSHIK